jgi:hypothetical protein
VDPGAGGFDVPVGPSGAPLSERVPSGAVAREGSVTGAGGSGVPGGRLVGNVPGDVVDGAALRGGGPACERGIAGRDIPSREGASASPVPAGRGAGDCCPADPGAWGVAGC